MMKILPVCVITLLIALNSAGQAPPGPPKIVIGANHNCIYKKKYSLEERLKMFQFEEGDTVKLVSFLYMSRNLPVSGNNVIKEKLKETKVLSYAETATLTDILYNNFIIKSSGIGRLEMCFTPRNAILVFTKDGKLKNVILICFHCNRFESSHKDLDLGETCDQKMAMVRGFFVSKGVYFGTDMKVYSYPGESLIDDVPAPPSNNN